MNSRLTVKSRALGVVSVIAWLLLGLPACWAASSAETRAYQALAKMFQDGIYDTAEREAQYSGARSGLGRAIRRHFALKRSAHALSHGAGNRSSYRCGKKRRAAAIHRPRPGVISEGKCALIDAENRPAMLWELFTLPPHCKGCG